jgi:hypothetical protein
MCECRRNRIAQFAGAFLLVTVYGFGQVSKSGAAEVTNNRRSLNVPASWHKLDAGPFSILAPSDWEFHRLPGVDSYVGEFVGDGIVLTFDFGHYSSGYIKKLKRPAYVLEKKSIGRHTAKIASPQTPGQGITSIYFSKACDHNALYLWGKDLNGTHQQLALQIFETIQFGGPLPQSFIPPPPPPAKQIR